MSTNKVKNKKLLSAIMLGISSMMFLQTPITAYANDPGSESDNENQHSQESDQTAGSSDDDIVDEALSYDAQTIDDALDHAEDMADAANEAIGAPEDNDTNENAGEANSEAQSESGADASAGTSEENSGSENGDNLPDEGNGQESGSPSAEGNGQESGASSTDGNEPDGGTDEEQNNSAASEGGDSIILEDTGLGPAVPEATEAANIILEGDADKNVGALSVDAAPDNAVNEIGDLIAAAKEVVEDTEKPVVNGTGNESASNEGGAGANNAGGSDAGNADGADAGNAGGSDASNAGGADAGNAGEDGTNNADNNNDGAGNTTSSTYTDPSAVKSLANSAGDVEAAKKALEEAEQANEEADEAYKEAANAFKEATDCITDDGAVPGLITSSEIISGIVKEADEEALSFINEIENAENVEQIRQAEEKFRQAKDSRKSEYDAQLEWNQLLSEKYNQAVTELEAAQKKLDEAEVRFGEKLGTATDKVDAAQKEVAAAKTKVDNLALALDTADKAIDEAKNNGEYQLTDTKGEDWSGKFGVGIDKSRQAMDTVIVNYYLPEVCQLDLVEDDEHKTSIVHKAFSGSNGEYEKNYTEVTYYYKDANGTIQQGTKYFNWDSIAKTDVDHHNLLKKNTAEAATGIVMYEKSEGEVKGTETKAKAMEVLSSSITEDNSDNYLRNGKSILHKDNIVRCTEQGMLRLYSFVDENGEEKKITQFELYGKYPAVPNVTYNDEGDLTKKMTTEVTSDGSILYTAPNGSVYKNLTMVTPAQNQNGLYKDANCLILGDNETISNVLKGEGGYSYVKTYVVDKYNISAGKI
ncbi:MAG: hypothetical protein K6E91_01925 [Butyrivibrio sp.]|nr:hypothetical protein [Butyrivibrio sp.]